MTDSLLEAFEAAVARHPDRTALVEGDRTRVSFRTLSDRATGMAAHWASHGVSPGDRLLLAMPLGADLYAALAAIWSLGAIAVLPEPAMGLRGVRVALKLAGCKGLVASGHYVWLRLLLPGLWFKPLFRPVSSDTSLERVPVSGDDVALISFTSGSTGLPKAIPRNHAFLQAQRAAVAPILDSDREEIDLVVFPVFVLVNLAEGRTSVLPNWRMSRADRVTPPELSGWIAAQRVTRALLPPALCDTLAGSNFPRSLASVFTGGGPVFPDLVDRLQAAKPDLRIVAVYGSTEAEPIAELDMADMTPENRRDMASGRGLLAGPPVGGIEVRIVEGEIVVTGDHVNKGYLDPARDAETKFAEGGRIWHRTGDAGALDADGRLWLLGRHGADVGGLFPFAVETSARMWPGVRRAALANVGGKPLLAIEGDGDELNIWQSKAAELGIGEVRPVPAIPMDRRHRSKVDYVALGRMLSD